jgi:hypothetical protein
MSFTPRRQELAAPQAGVKRVHCLGDSMMCGAGVTAEESLPVQLEQVLHHDFPQELFACINFGHEGWNLWNSLLHNEAIYPEGGCDLLILSLCSNDCEIYGCGGLIYSQDKPLHWEDDLLHSLVDRGLEAFKDYTQRHAIPALIIYYEVYISAFMPIRDTLKKLCAKHGIPYLNVTQAMHETHHLPLESLRVSSADGHPSALYHQLAARLISAEINRLHLLQNPPQDDVVDRLSTAAQSMLDDGYDPQTVFAWALRAAQAKAICLPRRETNGNKRKIMRERLTEVADLVTKDWAAWQKSMWHEAILRNVHSFMQEETRLFFNVASTILNFMEIIRLAVWCVQDGKLSILEKYMRPLFKEYPTFDPSQFPMQLLSALNNLAEIAPILAPDEAPESHLRWPKPNGLNVNCTEYLKNWSFATAQSLRIIILDLVFLLNDQSAENSLAEKFWGFLGDRLASLIGSLNTISKKVASHINQNKATHPLLGVDVEITVCAANPDSLFVNGNGIAVKIRSLIPATVNDHSITQSLDNTVAKMTYRFRLPLFVQAHLQFFTRWNFLDESQLEKFGFTITRIVMRPAFTDVSLPAPEIVNVDLQGQNLNNVKLENFRLNV